MMYLDANTFLRALTTSPDEPVQHMNQAAGELFHQMERGEVVATTSDAIFAEVAFILTSKAHYHLPVDDASDRIGTLVRLRGLRLRDKKVILEALDVWKKHPGLGFVDALAAAHAMQPGTILVSFDADFDRVSGVARWQPEAADNEQT